MALVRLLTTKARPLARLLTSMLVVAALPALADAQPSRFTLDVSPTSGNEADQFTVTVRLQVAGVTGPERYTHPDLSDFEVVDTQYKQSTSMQVVPGKGRRLHSQELRRYILKPKRVGRFAIGPAKVRIGGKDFETRRVIVQVRSVLDPKLVHPPPTSVGPDPTVTGDVGAPGFKPPDPSITAEMFIHPVVDKTELTVGEQVTVTWLLYTRTEVLKFEPRPPRLDNLWSETLFEPDAYFTYHDDRVGRNPYLVTIIAKRALFPTKAGRVEIMPFVAKIATLNTALGRPKRVASPRVVLTVNPLPAGAPNGFDDTYVGQFTATAEVDRTEIDASESLTLTLTVSATGAIRRTRPPQLQVGAFQFRSPRDFDETLDFSNDIVKGQRVYRYWTTPQQGGKQTIPPIEIIFYDPVAKRYDVARTKAISITVTGDPNSLSKVDVGPTRENTISKDIRLIRDGQSIESRTVARLHRSPWFWGASGVPLFAFLMVVVVDRLRQRLKKETPRARLRRARGRAKKRFRVAEIHSRGNRPAKFFGELSHVLYDYIEERVGQPVQSMTRDELEKFLEEKGFDATTIRQISADLEAFDFARFAPSAAEKEEMQKALRQVKELLKRIERAQVDDDDLDETEDSK